MTTTFDDAPDRVSGADEAPAGEALPRVRRFAPRRSRSAGAPASITPAEPAVEPAQLHEHGQPVEADSALATQQAAVLTPAPVVEPVPGTQATPAVPARNRRSRPRRAVAATAEPQASEPPAEAAVEAVAPVIDDQGRGDREAPPLGRVAEIGLPTTEDVPPAIEAPEQNAPAEGTAPAPRAARSRTRRRPAAAKGQAVEAPLIEEAEAAPVADVPAAIAEPAETPARTTRTRRPRRRQVGAAPPTEDQETPIVAADLDTPEAGAALAASAPIEADESASAVEPDVEPLTAWFPAGEMTQNSPKGELDGTEALARALLEMFPPAAHEESPTADEAEPTDREADDVLAEAQAILEDQDGEEEAEDGSPRKRSRRGRRGGRGRRRGGLAAMPSTEMQAPYYAEPDGDSSLAAMANGDLAATVAASPDATIADSAPAASSDATPYFVPENPPRSDRPWRERGPRRLWNRSYGRETAPPPATPPASMPQVSMPPPKPSNGARFAPIPQAAPPLSAVAQPEIVVSAPSMFVMPDLRLNEPLAPGETRTERLLEAQTRLLQAMLEQQARQIDVLTGTVNSLRQTVQNLGTGGELHTYQPRTGIFVDAPNVCYAADNARVNLDYARMLKYLSRDRHLVHAFAYSPIIDDVREGIRYETQRFVAPFLRAGYKLVTKPLKRFSDGSAKGNFDIELAVDIVTMSERLDLVVLVSGDSDFERLIQLIQSRGVRVEVVAFASNVSTELVNIADVFIDINQHIEHLRVL